MEKSFEFDVALSFAGEDREYVEHVARALKAEGLSVFYDAHEAVSMWGKDLTQHLDEVYRTKARYCVVFISKHYAAKAWTNYELKSALARALTERAEYILPARFDDTDIPGVRPTLGYLDLRTMSAEQLASHILEKLTGLPSSPNPNPEYRVPKLKRRHFNPYDEGHKFIVDLKDTLTSRCRDLEADGVSCSVFERGDRTCFRLVYLGRTAYSLDVWMGGLLGGDSSLGFYGHPGETTASTGSSNAWGRIEDNGEETIIRLNDLSLLGHLPGDKPMRPSELINAIWEQFCLALERVSKGGAR